MNIEQLKAENKRLRDALQSIVDYKGNFCEDDPKTIASDALSFNKEWAESPLESCSPDDADDRGTEYKRHKGFLFARNRLNPNWVCVDKYDE